jgi:peptidoglycan/LPS O-acetylase OafA/YrhL
MIVPPPNWPHLHYIVEDENDEKWRGMETLLSNPKTSQTSQIAPVRKNFAFVDHFRGLGILFVLLFHLNGMYGHWELPYKNGMRDFTAYGPLESIWLQVVYLATSAVPIFWVLSGFCIHWSCLRWERFKPFQFFSTRFFRVYPVFLVTLIVFAVTELQGKSLPEIAVQFFSHLFLVHNLFPETFYGIYPPAWSLAAEFQLYLVYPLLLIMRRRIGWRNSFLLAGGLALLFQVAAASRYHLNGDVITAVVVFSPLSTWIDWMLGAFIAEKYALGQRAFPRSNLFLAAAFASYLVSTFYEPLMIFTFFLASLTGALVLDKMIHRREAPSKAPSRTGKVLTWFGFISYSAYLWHMPIMQHAHDLLKRFGPVPGGVEIAVALFSFLLSVAIAYASFRLLEVPGIKLGKAFFAYFSQPKKVRKTESEISTDGMALS